MTKKREVVMTEDNGTTATEATMIHDPSAALEGLLPALRVARDEVDHDVTKWREIQRALAPDIAALQAALAEGRVVAAELARGFEEDERRLSDPALDGRVRPRAILQSARDLARGMLRLATEQPGGMQWRVDALGRLTPLDVRHVAVRQYVVAQRAQLRGLCTLAASLRDGRRRLDGLVQEVVASVARTAPVPTSPPVLPHTPEPQPSARVGSPTMEGWQ